MHEAYHLHQVVKLPLRIECIEAFDDNLVVGTQQGHLLMYSVGSNQSSDGAAANTNGARPSVQLLRTNKYFSKKPILQLAAVSEYSILVALTDSVISVHDIDLAVTNFPTICRVDRTRGASAFALDVTSTKTLTGETVTSVRMVVAVKKKLQFYYWKNRKFHELMSDYSSLSDVPRSLAWCHQSVCIGFRGEYAMLHLKDIPEMISLFPIEPKDVCDVQLMQDDRFALSKGKQTTFIDLSGQMKLFAVSWTETPTSIAHNPPYLISAIPDSDAVEVRTSDEPRLYIQNLLLEKEKPKFVVASKKSGRVFVASQSSKVWALSAVSNSVQIPQLLQEKQFELAIALAKLGKDNLEGKSRRIRQIKTLFAFDLFCEQFNFEDSLEVFYNLDIDPCHVVGLVPSLLPRGHREKIKYPDKLPSTLQGRDLENALLAMIKYLTKTRHKLQGEESKTINYYMPIAGGEPQSQAKLKIMEIIDTTLLKCYLKTNDALVSSLLRLKANYCHEAETVRVLKKADRIPELVIYYQAKEKHQEALDLMKEQFENCNNKEQSKWLTKSVQYLQNLFFEDNSDLVFNNSAWILNHDEEQGLKIFTSDLDDVIEATEDIKIKMETDKRIKVYKYLMNNVSVASIIAYLKHVIAEWGEENAFLHDQLVLRYKDHVVQLKADEADEEIEETKEEMREFLATSEFYTPALIYPNIPPNPGLFDEERAILLGKLDRHEEALILHLYQLKDPVKVEAYCAEYYQSCDRIYTILFRLQLNPPKPDKLRSMGILLRDENVEGDLSQALKTLDDYGDKVDFMTALKNLPDSVPIRHISGYLTSNLGKGISERNRGHVERGLAHAEHVMLQDERLSLEAQSVEVGPGCKVESCEVCQKRFKNQSAVVRVPGRGSVVHFSCQDKLP